MTHRNENILWFKGNTNNTFVSTLLWVLDSYLHGRYRYGTRLIGWIPNETDETKNISNSEVVEPVLLNNDNNNNNKEQKNVFTSQRLTSSENDLASLGKSESQRHALATATFQRNPAPLEPQNDFSEYDVHQVSPAWGFYVAITPEQQELFSHSKTSSATYRKSPLW